jgi:hypothetical protein
VVPEHGMDRWTFLGRGAAVGGAVALADAVGSACGSSPGGLPYDDRGWATKWRDPAVSGEVLSSSAAFDLWILVLRSGVAFHDGSRLIAAVVKANFDALRTRSLTKSAVAGITSITTPDPSIDLFSLEGLAPGLPTGLTTEAGYGVAQVTLDLAPLAGLSGHPDGYRTDHVLAVAARQPLHNHPQSPPLAGIPPVSGSGHVPPLRRYHPTSGLTPDRIGGRHDLPRSADLPKLP